MDPIVEQLGSSTGTTPSGSLTSFSTNIRHFSHALKHHSPRLSPLATEHTLNPILRSYSAAPRPSHVSGLFSQGCKRSRAVKSVQSVGSIPNLSSLMGSASVTRPPSLRAASVPPVWLLKAVHPTHPFQPLPLIQRPSRIATLAKRLKPSPPQSPHL